MMRLLALVLASQASFASGPAKSVLPLPLPDVTCLSEDGAWGLLINTDLGVIRVVDEGQKRLSHRVNGLIGKKRNGKVQLFNDSEDNGLPMGLVFEANLRKPGTNAFGVDDASGRKTLYACRKSARQNSQCELSCTTSSACKFSPHAIAIHKSRVVCGEREKKRVNTLILIFHSRHQQVLKNHNFYRKLCIHWHQKHHHKSV